MSTLTKRSTYQNIATDLRFRIERGEYLPGDRLPNDGELSERYGVSRATLRSAIELLKSEGIVQAMHGVGRFVCAPPHIRELSRADIERLLNNLDVAQGTDHPSTAHIRFEPADQRNAQLFGVSQGTELTVRELVIREEGVPMLRAMSTVPRTLTSGTELEQPDPGNGVTARLRTLGKTLCAKETIHARVPTEWERTLLDLPDYRPLLLISRVTYTSSSPQRVLESRDIALRADRFRLLDNQG